MSPCEHGWKGVSVGDNPMQIYFDLLGLIEKDLRQQYSEIRLHERIAIADEQSHAIYYLAARTPTCKRRRL